MTEKKGKMSLKKLVEVDDEIPTITMAMEVRANQFWQRQLTSWLFCGQPRCQMVTFGHSQPLVSQMVTFGHSQPLVSRQSRQASGLLSRLLAAWPGSAKGFQKLLSTATARRCEQWLSGLATQPHAGHAPHACGRESPM
jgi:hypothetical protein